MKKILFLLAFLYSLSFALKNEWTGYIEESAANLNDGESVNIILKSDPNAGRGNNFGYQNNTNFTYSTNSGSSTITLQADSAISDMMYYHRPGNTISINKNSNLIWNLNTSNGMIIEKSSINIDGGTLELNKAEQLDNQAGSITVSNGGTFKVSGVSLFKNQSALNGAASITNSGGTIYINADFYNYNQQKSSYTRPNNGGYFLQNDGTTTITGSFYNAGFYNDVSNGQRMDALLEIKGGEFKVNGDFENGKNNPNGLWYTDYYGIGVLKASNALITVGGNFLSDAQGQGDNGNWRSTVDLNDATLMVKGNFNAHRSDISLTNSAKIYTTNFNLDSSATMNFIGSDLGFGYINASNQATFDGTTNFKLAGAIAKNDNMSYLFLESKAVTGIQEGAVTVYDSQGQVLSGYTSKIVKIGDKYFLVFGTANDTNDPNYPQADATPPGGHAPGYNPPSGGGDQGGSGSDGGDGGDGEQGGNSGSGGGNQGDSSGNGGNSGGSTNTPIYTNPKDAIAAALKDSYIIGESDLQKATSDIENQFSLMQEERKTYQGSLMQHNMLGRIANLSRQRYAFNTEARFASLLADYARVPYYATEQESNNFYINALAGYSNYQNSNGSEYGVSLGYDKEVPDSFFGGFYASLSKSYIKTEGMNLDGFNYNVGLYSRVYMPFSMEIDLLGYYANSHNRYDRTFAGLTNAHKGDYKRHNIGAQARLGYRAEFVEGHSLKPYVGVLSSFYYMPAYKENGALPISRSLNSFTSLYGVLGLEYRKIMDDGSFFISLEGVNGAPVFGHKSYEITMGGQRISYENEKEFFANVFAGANFSVSKYLDFTASVMSQAYEGGFFNINGNLGFRLSF